MLLLKNLQLFLYSTPCDTCHDSCSTVGRKTVNATFRPHADIKITQSGSPGDKVVAQLKSNGPKLLVSQEAIVEGSMCWVLLNHGNSACEVGVVSAADIHKQDALHKEGRTGLHSTQTAGSVLATAKSINNRPVEVCLDMSGIPLMEFCAPVRAIFCFIKKNMTRGVEGSRSRNGRG